MVTRVSILKWASAMLMIVALLFLTTANFWAYRCKTEKQAISSLANSSDEEQDAGASVPNPVEEKNSNTLQNLSEYLHDHQHTVFQPVCVSCFGNRHDIINLPIHHPELLTPPPRLQA
jgi:hypothetical protein